MSTIAEQTRGVRPCGACGEYVPELTGCVHWRPGLQANSATRQARTDRERERRRQQNQQVEAIRRMLTLNVRG